MTLHKAVLTLGLLSAIAGHGPGARAQARRGDRRELGRAVGRASGRAPERCDDHRGCRRRGRLEGRLDQRPAGGPRRRPHQLRRDRARLQQRLHQRPADGPHRGQHVRVLRPADDHHFKIAAVAASTSGGTFVTAFTAACTAAPVLGLTSSLTCRAPASERRVGDHRLERRAHDPQRLVGHAGRHPVAGTDGGRQADHARDLPVALARQQVLEQRHVGDQARAPGPNWIRMLILRSRIQSACWANRLERLAPERASTSPRSIARSPAALPE